jgi:four helix bundle protein
MNSVEWKDTSIEQTDLYLRASSLADQIWIAAKGWRRFEQDTVGTQLARSTDSIAANLVEGDGRAGGADSIRFFVIARASARESRHWVRRAIAREIIDNSCGEMCIDELTQVVRMINALIRYRVTKKSVVKEERAPYGEESLTDDFDLPVDSLVPSSLVPSP